MMFRALAVWLVFMFAAIANGAFRERALNSIFGEATGHVVSTLLLCTLITVVSWASIVWLNPTTSAKATRVAVLWILMTVAFEFGFGHFVAGKSWATLFGDYNVFRGRVWVLVLIVLAEAPYRSARLRGLF
jgi:hypothetical protein